MKICTVLEIDISSLQEIYIKPEIKEIGGIIGIELDESEQSEQ